MKRLSITPCHSRASFPEMKSIVENILSRVGADNYEVQKTRCPCYIPGRASKFTVNGNVLARFGEIHPEVLQKWDLEMPTAGGEICVDLLFKIISGKEIKPRVTKCEINIPDKNNKSN
jgi:phenylalanyl-tRNA synthetase beta chain